MPDLRAIKPITMAYRVRIGRLEIECESLADLDDLVARYAGEVPSGSSTLTQGAAPKVSNSSAPMQRDQILLRQLVQAGEGGIDAGTVSSLLGGARGRAVPVAVRRWATRVGLADNEDNSVMVAARPGGQRGWRLSSGALGAARAMLQNEGAP